MSGKVQGDAAARKAQPIVTGVLDYFPDALLEVAQVSRIGNEQHNPGEPLHWAKEKSTDEADACVRHLIDRGQFDTDGTRHSAKAAWRALALLQREIEAERELCEALKPVAVPGCDCGTCRRFDPPPTTSGPRREPPKPFRSDPFCKQCGCTVPGCVSCEELCRLFDDAPTTSGPLPNEDGADSPTLACSCRPERVCNDCIHRASVAAGGVPHGRTK